MSSENETRQLTHEHVHALRRFYGIFGLLASAIATWKSASTGRMELTIALLSGLNALFWGLLLLIEIANRKRDSDAS